MVGEVEYVSVGSLYVPFSCLRTKIAMEIGLRGRPEYSVLLNLLG